MAELESVEVIYHQKTNDMGFPWPPSTDAIAIKYKYGGEWYGNYVTLPQNVSAEKVVTIVNLLLGQMVESIRIIQKGVE